MIKKIIVIILFTIIGMAIILTPFIITSNTISEYVDYCEEKNWNNETFTIELSNGDQIDVRCNNNNEESEAIIEINKAMAFWRK